MFSNLRPGVYARYDISGAGVPKGGRAAALVLRTGDGIQPGLHEISRHRDIPVFAHPAANGCVRLLLEGGAGKVYLLFCDEGADIFAEIKSHDDIYTIICDEAIQPAPLFAYLSAASAAQRECIAFIARDGAEEAAAAAEKFSHRRVCLCAPAALAEGEDHPHSLYTACAFAAAIISAASPLTCFSGMELPLLKSVKPLTEGEIQRLLSLGVCLFEEVGGVVRLIRAATISGDKSTRSLNTLLITDHVLKRIRARLRRMLTSGGISPQSIRDQVVVELAGMTDEGIITGFEPPFCRTDREDPTLCLIDIAFSAAHLIDRIYLTLSVNSA